MLAGSLLAVCVLTPSSINQALLNESIDQLMLQLQQ
jgi:hypothetical protein